MTGNHSHWSVCLCLFIIDTEPCPSEWVVYNDNCYGVVNASCSTANGLATEASITTEEENTFVMDSVT